MSLEAIILLKMRRTPVMQKIVAQKEEELRIFIKSGSHELNICSAKIMSDIIAKTIVNFVQ